MQYGLAKLIALAFAMQLVVASAFGMERRRDQFPDLPGYVLFPVPYQIPGVGSGLIWAGYVANAFSMPLDAYGMAVTGDAEGRGVGIFDFHLLPKMLILEYSASNFDRIGLQVYARGMDSGAEDFLYLIVGNARYSSRRVILTFWERRIELFHQAASYGAQLNTVLDENEMLLAEPKVRNMLTDGRDTLSGIQLDFTDDYNDPRQGWRFVSLKNQHEATLVGGSDYNNIDFSLTGYLPLGHSSVFAMNAFRSDAQISSQGETNRNRLRELLHFQCDNAQCRAKERIMLDSLIQENRFGRATSLGGISRLRGYPSMRFAGAHTAFLGAELRWNLTDEFTPFDYGFAKDVRTGIQVALFHELGSVAEWASDLGRDTKASSGLGFRLVAGSGLVYRIDFGVADEGGNTTALVTYPW